MANMKKEQLERENHSNQIFSQILLPFLLAFAVVAYAGYFLFSTLISGSIDFRIWSDISVMLIFLPLILLALPWIMLLIVHIFLVVKIQQIVLDMGEKTNPVFTRILRTIADLGSFPTKPLIALMSGFPFFRRQK